MNHIATPDACSMSSYAIPSLTDKTIPPDSLTDNTRHQPISLTRPDTRQTHETADVGILSKKSKGWTYSIGQTASMEGMKNNASSMREWGVGEKA